MQPSQDLSQRPSVEQIQDPRWRLANLYHITDKAGNVVLFKPSEVQTDLLDNLYRRNLILKARQLGFSTLVQLMILDQCIFVPNTHAGVIAQDRESAAKIFDNKIKFAWDRMPAWVKQYVRSVGDNANELALSNGSYVRVATSLRSDTLQFLHVSEFGKICAKYPQHAKEIVTGTLPALGDDAICVIESTAEGREGKFFEMCQAYTDAKRNNRIFAPLDFRMHFYAWFDCPDYSTEFAEEFTADDIAYFASIDLATGVELSLNQRNWYKRTLRSVFAGDAHQMRQEYPSLPDEAFERDTEGSWFGTQIGALRNAKRIDSIPHVPGVPVDTFWDIGRTDGTAVWCMQRIGIHYRFIDFIEGRDLDYDHYASELLKRPYVYGRHFLPHDAAHVRQAESKEKAKSPEQILNGLGLRNTKIVPRTEIKINSINAARRILPQCMFDELRCAAGIIHLESYRKKWSTSLGMYLDEPIHDLHSEAADAFQQFACGWTEDRAIDPKRFAAQINQTNPFSVRQP